MNRPTNASRSSWGTPISPQVGRDEREDLADAERLDHRGQPEDDEQTPPVLGGSGSGRRVRGGGHRRSLPARGLIGRASGPDRFGLPRTRKRPKELVGGPPVVSQRLRTSPESLRSARDPRSTALRPSNPAPGTVPRIAPRCGLAVRTCPFGQDEMYPPGRHGHNGLIHELRPNRPVAYPRLSHRCGRNVDDASRRGATSMHGPRRRRFGRREVVDGTTAGSTRGH